MYSCSVLWVILALLLVIAGLVGALLAERWYNEHFAEHAPRRRRRVRASYFKDHCYDTYCVQRRHVEGRQHGAEEDGPPQLH